MIIKEVSNSDLEKAFDQVPNIIYKKDPNFIKPLKQDLDFVFNPKLNRYFKHGELSRFVLFDEKSRPIGKIAAFINHKTANTFEQPSGGIGFFDCINDQTAANLLFDAAKEWLAAKKMEAMDGPINFGEKDKWWGLLVEQFVPASYGMNYNPPYYQSLFEHYGFRVYYEQLTYRRSVHALLHEKYVDKANRIFKDPNFHFKTLSRKNLDKYIADFTTIYNAAWVSHNNFKPMAVSQARSLFYKLKPVMDEQLIWFTYYENRPIGFFLMLPELNQIFKYVNGNLDWLGKIIFMWHKWMRTVDTIFGLAFGIVPEYQGIGVEGAMIQASANIVQKQHQYKTLEITWIGDFNPRMLHLMESFGATIYKKHYTYRYLFDRNKEFKRMPVIHDERRNGIQKS